MKHDEAVSSMAVGMTADGRVRLDTETVTFTMTPDLARWLARKLTAAAYLVDPKSDEDE